MLLNKQRLNSRNRCQAASIIIEDLNLQKKFHTVALVGLINFTNMIITNIITRRHEFATMQSIGMTNRQLQRLMVYEGVYYAAGADIIGGVVALLLAVTVLENVLNSPSMWFFTMNITLVPVLVIGVPYLLLAAVIPLIVLHFFNKGTVVERLRTSE